MIDVKVTYRLTRRRLLSKRERELVGLCLRRGAKSLPGDWSESDLMKLIAKLAKAIDADGSMVKAKIAEVKTLDET